MSSFTSDPRAVGLALIAMAIALAIAAFFTHRKRKKIERISRPPTLAAEPGTSGQPSGNEQASPPKSTAEEKAIPGPRLPSFITFQKPGLAMDLLRALLIALSLTVAVLLILALLPHSVVDRLAASLDSRHRASRLEKIAFIYLGDENINNELHIRGLVRNISTEPIEQLDAVIRFYAHNRSLLETTIVRMNKEIINPEENAQFELVHPNYQAVYAGYSTEFKLRQGDPVPYLDMRKPQPQPE